MAGSITFDEIETREGFFKTKGKPDQIDWLPDGSLLASGLDTGGRAGLYRLDPKSGAAALVAASSVPAWAPKFALALDGNSAIRFYHQAGFGFESVDLGSGAVRKLSWPKPSFRPFDMSLSRDGKQLALFEGNGIEVIDTESGTIRKVAVTGGNWPTGHWAPDGRSLIAAFGPGQQPTILVKVPVTGEEADRDKLGLRRQYSDSRPSAWDRGLRLSPDGQTAALLRWTEHRQVWALENFLPAASARK